MVTIRGTNGNNTLRQGNNSEVRIFGLDGNDKISLTLEGDLGGGNFVDAGDGNDQVANRHEGDNVIKLGAGNDLYAADGFSLNLNGGDEVFGGSGADRFFVDTNVSIYNGDAGNDRFFTTGHKNDFNGGAGFDTISYEFRHEDSVVGDIAVEIRLDLKKVFTNSNSFEEANSIENAIGSRNDDFIIGSNSKNTLHGSFGDDQMDGLGGNDVIFGGRGGDTLFGGSGSDHFVFESKFDSPANLMDIIADFSRSQGDKIDLSDIDADPQRGGNQAFRFVQTDFTGGRGQVRFEGGGVFIDIDGNRASDMNGLSAMTSSDFIL